MGLASAKPSSVTGTNLVICFASDRVTGVCTYLSLEFPRKRLSKSNLDQKSDRGRRPDFGSCSELLDETLRSYLHRQRLFDLQRPVAQQSGRNSDEPQRTARCLPEQLPFQRKIKRGERILPAIAIVRGVGSSRHLPKQIIRKLKAKKFQYNPRLR